MLNAGKLRHRIIIQRPVETQDVNTGDMLTTWQDVATVWCAIEPISAREFITAQVESSKVDARITIRYRADINHTMRLVHLAKDKIYNIEGVLSDKNSGLEYLTLPCSEGVRYSEQLPDDGDYVTNNGDYVTNNGDYVVHTIDYVLYNGDNVTHSGNLVIL